MNDKGLFNRLKNRKIYLLIFTLLPLIMDIITKQIIRNSLELYQSIPVIKGFFNIVYVLNPGAAFGFMRDMNETYRQLFFVIITIIAILIIFYMFLKEQTRAGLISFALIISGAAGNLIDRIYISKVVDFLDFHIKEYHWPAFNVADICITIGVGLMIIDIIFIKKDNKIETS